MNAPHRRSRLADAVLALAAALTVASAPPAAAEGTSPPPAPPAEATPLEAMATKARAVLQGARGLEFKSAVPVAAVDREGAFAQPLRDLERVLGGADRMAATGRLLVRLGVVPEGADLKALLMEYLPSAVAARYDTVGKRISFMPGTKATLPLMVHEMTHALDDQHFDFEALVTGMNGEFDRTLAFGALAEGDAESMEYRVSMPGMFEVMELDALRMQGEAMAQALLRRGGRTPPALALAFASQYVEGVVFVESLRRSERGEAAVDDAFRRPPASSEQVLHPEKFLADETPVVLTLAAPPAGTRVTVDTPLGELCTSIVLRARGVAAPAARAAAAGWGGDRIALLSLGEEEAFVWISAWDTEADAEEFEKALATAFPPPAEGAEGAPVRTVARKGDGVLVVEAPAPRLAAVTDWAASTTRTRAASRPRETAPAAPAGPAAPK